MQNTDLKEKINEMSLGELSKFCHSIAKEKGFWDKERNMGEALMLIVTELAEAMEAYRIQDKENFREEQTKRRVNLPCAPSNYDHRAFV